MPAMPDRPRPPRPERFDVLDASGNLTGRTRRRDLVHRHGDWHRAFHCWIVVESREGTPALILQRRADDKDTWPGALDVSVGGHYRAGETLADVLREMHEEVGQGATLDALRFLGRRTYVCDAEVGTRDREIQDVFMWRTPIVFDAFRPNPEEVAALELVTVADFLALATRNRSAVHAHRLLPDGAISESTVHYAELIPSVDGYFQRAAVAIDLAIKGYPHPVV
jgi:isopentenyldiphosphate isomerase